MKVDYIGTQWPLGPDKGPSAASHPAGCVFLISHCFSLREGHLLIDCLNLLRINTAGSLCDAYPKHPLTPSLSLPVSAASQRVVRENERLHQISAHFLTGPLSWPVPFISPFLWGFMDISDNKEAEQTREIHCGPYHLKRTHHRHYLWAVKLIRVLS